MMVCPVFRRFVLFRDCVVRGPVEIEELTMMTTFTTSRDFFTWNRSSGIKLSTRLFCLGNYCRRLSLVNFACWK